MLSKDKILHSDSFNIFLFLSYTNTTNARAERKKKCKQVFQMKCSHKYAVYKFRYNHNKEEIMLILEGKCQNQNFSSF